MLFSSYIIICIIVLSRFVHVHVLNDIVELLPLQVKLTHGFRHTVV